MRVMVASWASGHGILRAVAVVVLAIAGGVTAAVACSSPAASGADSVTEIVGVEGGATGSTDSDVILFQQP